MYLASYSMVLVFLLMAGSGCKEQETKSKERGKAVMDNIKGAEKSARDAVSKMQKDADQFEQENK